MLEQIASQMGLSPNQIKKALLELQDRRTAVVAGAAANTAIAVPNITLDDTIARVLMFASGVPSDVTANASIVDLRASGTITVGSPAAGATVTIKGKVFTAVAASGVNDFAGNGAGVQKFALGGTAAVTAANLAKSINAAAIGVIASAASNVVTVIEVAAGTAGNSSTLVGSTGFTASGATLTGGSATNAIKVSSVTTGNTLLVEWFKKPSLNA